MHAEHDAAVGIGRGPQKHVLIILRHEHREQDRVGVGVGRMAARKRRVGGETGDRRRVELVDAGRRHLHRARAAEHVLVRIGVLHTIGDVIDAVRAVRQAVGGRQREAGRRDVGGGAVDRAVGEVEFRGTEIVTRKVGIGAGQQGNRIGEDRCAACNWRHAPLIDGAENRAQTADRLDRRDAAVCPGHRGLRRQAAREVGRDADVADARHSV